ncbi:PREDICTED: increased DNA methylation 2-like [Camelina sativa]|uniref:Increased DNA methylation 2-like n=1 Tax=Camelina sativa TaxID=90675 RepID=A0ABM0SR48_CAMSA|nr:PREDICTED: increased DNA methylation 2-like [Camelina sativa]
MSDTMCELAAGKQEERVLISLDIEDDKLFLLHFIIGTYFGPDLRKRKHPKQQSAFQIQASKILVAADELSGSLMKRAEVERVYYHILRNVDQSLVIMPRKIRDYFNEKRNDSNGDYPLFVDLYPEELHPETRVRNRFKFIPSIAFINDPDTSCMREECVERFKRLTGLDSFALSITVDVTETNSVGEANEVEDKMDESLEPLKEVEHVLEVPTTCDGNDKAGTCTSGEESDVPAKPEAISEAQGGLMVGLMDIGECDDAYLFRVSLPGVKRDERDFSCAVEDNGKVLIRGVTTTGQKQVQRFSQVFEMQTQNLCLPGHFSVSFRLPGPVHPQEFSGNFGTDGILEGIVMKKLQKQTV